MLVMEVAMTRHRALAPAALLLLITMSCDDPARVVGNGGTGQGGTSSGGAKGGDTGVRGGEDRPDSGNLPSRISLALVASGLVSPVALRSVPDSSGRLFVAEQTGVVRIIENGQLSPAPVLDLTDRMLSIDPDDDERGLLGLALHPEFASNGRAFVHYSAPLRASASEGFDHQNIISEVRLDAPDGPNERVILEVAHPRSNHNGGAIAFGPDGYLYVGFGDGGGAGGRGLGHVEDWYAANEGGNGQDRTTNLLGSILRIDVNGAEPYSVPADNPFAGSPMPEVWAYGFRNPFQFSFDRGGAHQLFAGDVGQSLWEEVDIVTPGANYGWNVKEGSHCFSAEAPLTGLADCPDADPDGVPLVDPIIEYASINQEGGLGVSVIGGHVYRGAALPELTGKYIFGDWSTTYMRPDGHLFVASPPAGGGGPWRMDPLAIEGRDGGNLGEFVLGVADDAAGELYVLTSELAGPSGATGKVYRIER
jgi:glucose/arabinose dehydrogenase